MICRFIPHLDFAFRWLMTNGADLAWKSTLLLCIGGVVALGLRRSSAAARHLVWIMALTGVLSLSLFTAGLPDWVLPILPAEEVPNHAMTLTVSSASLVDTAPEPSQVQSQASETELPSVNTIGPASVPAPISPPWVWLLSGWALVALLLLARPLIGRLYLRRLARSARPLPPGECDELARVLSANGGLFRRVILLQSNAAIMPMTWGWLRPVILLPADSSGWSSARRRSVLLHELAHVQRLDCLTQTIAQAACAIYWFNPLVWLAARRLRIERERACDDLVLRNGTRPSDYSEHLLQMARELHAGRGAAVAALAMAWPSQLERRLLAILDPARRRDSLGGKSTAIAAVVLIALIVPLSAVHLIGRAADGTDQSQKSAAAGMIGKSVGEVRDDNILKMKFVWCPPGTITMEQVIYVMEPVSKKRAESSDDDVSDAKEEATYRHQVSKQTTLVKAFVSHYWIGKYEVTQSEWKQLMSAEPWIGHETTIAGFVAPPKVGDDFPATYIAWHGAMEFCAKLTDRERQAGRLGAGWEYTLPTEAQWERACRARTETRFSFGDDPSKLGDYAWFAGNALNAREPYAHRVGQKKPNAWGIHDMHGNAWEWCRDVWSLALPGGRDPLVVVKEAAQNPTAYSWVYRGAGWDREVGECHSAWRNGNHPTRRLSLMGFRVALSPIRSTHPPDETTKAP